MTNEAKIWIKVNDEKQYGGHDTSTFTTAYQCQSKYIGVYKKVCLENVLSHFTLSISTLFPHLFK